MKETFLSLFQAKKPLIAVIHLPPLPGAPRFSGDMNSIFQTSLQEADIFQKSGVDGIIIENFGDAPFFPGRVPAETVAAMSALSREIVQAVNVPVGINVLRNDAESALAISKAVGASFIRVNIHTGAALTDQGIIEGKAFSTLRLRKELQSKAFILADVAVKHASPLAPRNLEDEIKDTEHRGLADGIIISGKGTGAEIDEKRLLEAKSATQLPIITGSGITASNLSKYFPLADAFIVGSYFKKNGNVSNQVEEIRVIGMVGKFRSMRG